jgi:excisionase family DNA binding protein
MLSLDTRQALSIKQFCNQFGLGKDRFYEEVRLGRLRAIKVGHRTLILRADAERWLASLPTLDLAAA